MAITIIGTSHIARQSLNEVRAAIEEGKPDIIALELDSKRLPALLAKEKKGLHLSDIRKIGLKGFIFAALGSWAERKLGDAVGIKPGAEMKLAYELAKKNRHQVALIDQDIEKTLKRLSISLTWKEKFRFLSDVLKGVFGGKPEFYFDLSTVPDDKIISSMLERVQKRYPSIYRDLIDERNQVMIQNLKRIIDQNPQKSILVIVGAGHKEEIEEAVCKSYQVSVTYSLPKGMALSLGEKIE